MESQNPAGRPTVMTPDVLDKLEACFALGSTDLEACFYADINPATLYNYQQAHPEFLDRKEALKQTPILKARQTVVKNIDASFDNAMKYLEKKLPKEFGNKIGVGFDTPLEVKNTPLSPETIAAIAETFKNNGKLKIDDGESKPTSEPTVTVPNVNEPTVTGGSDNVAGETITSQNI